MKIFTNCNLFSGIERPLKVKNCGGKVQIPTPPAAAFRYATGEKKEKNQTPKVAPAQSESGSG